MIASKVDCLGDVDTASVLYLLENESLTRIGLGVFGLVRQAFERDPIARRIGQGTPTLLSNGLAMLSPLGGMGHLRKLRREAAKDEPVMSGPRSRKNADDHCLQNLYLEIPQFG